MIGRRLLWLAVAVAAPAMAEEAAVTIDPPPAGSVSRAAGLEAWGRIFQVVSHPRCSNCHVGASGIPMWNGLGYGEDVPHGMHVAGGESRIGAEFVPCQTCHATNTGGGNDVPHAAPQVAATWMLAPVEAEWQGKAAEEICRQLRDPDRNGGRSAEDLARHLGRDVILHWAWAPGGGRDPAPFTLQDHVNDILAWGAAGMPCADD